MTLDLTKIDLGTFKPLDEEIDPVQPVRSSLSEAVKVSPDEAASTRKLSQQSGVPEFALKEGRDEVEAKLRLDAIDLEGMSNRSPSTAGFFTDFNNASIAHDDIPVLEKIEGAIDAVQQYGADLSRSFQKGQKVVEASDIGLRRMYNALGAGELVSDEDIERLNILQGDIKRDLVSGDVPSPVSVTLRDAPAEDYGFITGAPVVAAEQLPIMWEIIKGGVAGAAVGGAGGAALGAVTGPGAAATGLFGAKWGGRLGVAKQAFDLEAGLAYNEFSALNDKPDGTGNTISPEIAAKGAAAVGGMNALLESLSFAALGRTVTPAMRYMLRNRVKQALSTETGREAIARIGGAYLTAVATESLTEGMQELTNVIGGEFVKLADKDAFTEQTLGSVLDVVLSAETADRVLEAATVGAQASLILSMPGTVASTVAHNRQQASLTENEQARIDAINASAQESKLKERDVETFMQFVEKADKDNNTTIFIDGAQAKLYLGTKSAEEIQADPALLKLSEQVNEAATLGNDVQISVADFAGHFTGTEHFDALREHMTLSGDSVSPFRAEQAQREQESYIQNLMRVAQENESSYVESQEIFTSVREQLIDTGRYDSRQAAAMAQVVPAYMAVYAGENGISVAEAYQRTGLRIVGPQSGRRADLEEGALRQTAPRDVKSFSESLAAELELDKLDVRVNRAGSLVVDSIIVPQAGQKAGKGTAAMERIVEFADERGMRVALTPAEEGDPGGTTSRARLVKFYKRFGFVENKGRNRDPEISEGMYRPAARMGEFAQTEEGSATSRNQAAEAKNRRGLEDLGISEAERTVNFEDWFDGSVVVDGNGDPLVMYHGTGNTDSVYDGGFRPELTGQGMDQAGSGFYFTTDPVEARGYETALTQNIRTEGAKLGGDTSPGTVEVYIAVKNPIVIPGTNLRDADVDLTADQVVEILKRSDIAKSDEDSPFGNFFEEYWEGGTQDWMYEAVAENYVGNSLISLEGDFFDGEATNFRKALRETLGFDGVIQEFEGGKRHVVAWFPEQIKSVYNTGAFDPRTGDILQQSRVLTDTGEGSPTWEAARAKGLDMSESARLARAKEMGFDIDTPVYHGTAVDFEAFDPDRAIGTQFWSTTDRAAIESGDVGAQGRGVIKKMYHRIQNPAGWPEYENLGIDEIIARGFDGLKLTDPDGHATMVAFDPNQYRSVDAAFDPDNMESPVLLAQGVGDGARGFYGPANSLIRLTESSDLSTFLHEFAHFVYETEMSAGSVRIAKVNRWFKRNGDAVVKEAAGHLKEAAGHLKEGEPTVELLEKFLDAGTTGFSALDSAFRRATHEQFARGFEAYLMEGKAPSVELRNAFRTFARWLVQVYRAVRGDLRVNLDDEMRAVFDRLLATEEQIAAAEARSQFEPLFTDAAMAGMTEEEFTRYKEKQTKAKDKAAETLRDKLIKQLRRQAESWWKEEKQDIIDEQLRARADEPVNRARETLRGDTLKLDHAATKALVGMEKTDKRGRTSVIVPTELRGMTAKGGTGVHPDEAAAFFGYSSGAEMLDDLISAPSAKDAAAADAERIMVERHGDILNDGSIEQEADAAVQNDAKGDVLLAELKALNKGTNRPNVVRATVKAIATDRIGKLSFREIHPEKYRRAEIRAAQDAARAHAAGNTEEAAGAKARQLMNHFLGMEATAAKNETMKIVDRMARYRKKAVREEIAKAGNDYLGQLDRVLERFEFRKGATLRATDEVNQSIQAWMEERITEDGDALVLSAAVLNESYVTHWKNVPYSELEGINDSVKNIEHVARYANRITRQQEEVDFKKLVQRWVSHIESAQPSRFKSQRTTVTEGRSWGRMAMAQMTKIPFLASWLDGGERAGMSHDILVQPFNDAYAEELKLWDRVAAKVLDAIQGRSKEDLKRHNRKLFIRELKDENHDGNLYGHQVLAVALNTGNAGNLRKMLLGEGWADPENAAEISLDNPKLQAVLRHMTKSDWEMVQLIWDQMEELYPSLAEVHRRTTGLTPPKVEATPVETQFGTFSGGYYPVKYDPNRSFRAEQREDRLNAETESMFGTVGIQASVNASATNERTGYFAPIRLSLDVVPAHFQETIHYITHHDAVRETNKLIKNAEVARVIKAKLGPEEYAQLRPWLNDIAKDGREAPMKTWWGSILQRLRFGTTLGVMGFKASTGIIQVSGLSNTVAEVGLSNVIQAARNILGSRDNMKDAWDFAAANSKILANRSKTMDREIKNAMERIQGKRGVLAAVQEASMKHIALIQTYTVDLPSWYAAYYKGLDQWGDEQRAYQYADWVVENVQGSGATKDMAQILRNQSQEARMFTMFMTFFSSLWNLERDLVKGGKSGLYSTTDLAAKGMFLFTGPVLFEMLMRGELGEPDDGDDERLQKFLVNSALFPVQSVPFLRDIASGVIGDYGYNISPLAQLIDTGVRTIPAVVTRGFTDEEITKSQAKGAARFIGAAAGVPGVSQAWATGEHMYDVIVEGEELTMHQLLFGPKRD